MLSCATTQAAIPGQSGSGGSDTQNYCYDEHNRLVWAANNGTIPSAGNGTCGNATMSSTLGGTYTARYAYTNLGQLWQGPQNGTGTQEQYLYCDSSHPHQLSNLSQVSSSPTCSSKGTIDYTGSYDAWGNTTSQQRGSTTTSTAYDAQDQLLHWSSTTNNQQEWYLYDASGERVLRRSFDGTNTTLTVYAFGLEEHQYAYSGSGSTATNTGNTYYYTLAGRLLGTWDGTSPTTTFLLTDSLGSVVSSFNNPSSGAVMQGNQLYGPYGNQRLKQGSVSTTKGFTGQYNDGLTGLDYYNARYYDPTIGLFLSADTVQGNAGGMDPYSYVGGNPESRTDPTGTRMLGPNGETAWINPNGTIYEDTPTKEPTVIGHTHPWFSSSPGGSSTGGHTNPKVTSTGHSKSQGCDATCGNRDKKLLADRIANERIHAQNIVALIADGASLVADLVAAGIDIATQTWGGFVIDAISVIARFGVVAADLSNLGVFHLDPTLVSVIGILKGAISIVDDIKGALELFNPLAFLQSKLKLVIAAAAPRVTDGIMEIIAGNTSYGGQIVNGIMDLHSFDAQNTEVQNYSNQQAHTMCLQDHASEPGIAC